MVNLQLKKITVVNEKHRAVIETLCKEKTEYFNELFKKYGKDLTLEIHFTHSSSKLYKVTATINLKSKNISVVEEDSDIKKAVTKLFSELKKAVKKQYELEKKDYEYKRKRK